jgi:FtsH-binding integral membrane protein
MNYYNILFFTLLSTFLLVLLIYKSAFKNGKPQCDNFVTNVYLYLALSFSMVGCFIHFYNYIFNKPEDVVKFISTKETIQQISKYIIISFMIALISIIILSFQPIFSKKGFILNHNIWILFLFSISLCLYPYFKSYEYSIQLQKILIMVSFIFLFMSLLVFIIPEFLRKTYHIAITGFLIALLTIIITELFLLLTGQYTKDKYNIISYFVILLFSLFITYDTSRLFEYAKICVNSPNYPLVSTNLFLDIINIFVRMMNR